MNLVFLHGASAVGKLTVAKALLDRIPGRLFDNHAAIDLALTVFDFGTPRFWELVDSVRLLTLESAARHAVPLVVITFCYAEPHDRAFFEQIEEIVSRHHGRLLPVFLHCSPEETERRVGGPDRVARGKLSSVEKLRAFNARLKFVPVPRAECLSLDTGEQAPQETAAAIALHFGLAREETASSHDSR